MFLDWNKAFDFLHHQILLLGITGLCNKWFNTYSITSRLHIRDNNFYYVGTVFKWENKQWQ